jgi:peptide/nickel transport system permease protein
MKTSAAPGRSLAAVDIPVATRTDSGSSLAVLLRLRRNRSATVASTVVALFLFVGIAAPLIAPSDPYSGDIAHRLEGPSPQHLLGTDELGRDILSRIIFGASMSLRIQFGVIGICLLGGVTLGMIAGYYGGWSDEVLMRLMDMLLAFPGVFLALAVVAALGPGTLNLVVAIGIALVPLFARLVRASVMAEQAKEFVSAARAVGAGDGRILVRHILPNCAAPLIVFTTLHLATVLLTAAGLSYLGLGVQPPFPEWGAMLSDSRTYFFTAPHAVVIPGAVIMLVSTALNVLGDGLREALDTRLRL